jgi:uncharacterized protein YecA (UPF0149 family)
VEVVKDSIADPSPVMRWHDRAFVVGELWIEVFRRCHSRITGLLSDLPLMMNRDKAMLYEETGRAEQAAPLREEIKRLKASQAAAAQHPKQPSKPAAPRTRPLSSEPIGLSTFFDDAVPARPRVGRNDPCPCGSGSGKKFNRCCMRKANED